MKKFQNPETVHGPLAGYSHQVEISGVKRWLVLSGQIGMLVDGTLFDAFIRCRSGHSGY